MSKKNKYATSPVVRKYKLSFNNPSFPLHGLSFTKFSNVPALHGFVVVENEGVSHIFQASELKLVEMTSEKPSSVITDLQSTAVPNISGVN